MDRMMSHKTIQGEQEKQRLRGLGTFAGVFTPSILTILGIILFLRLGYVIGTSGLARALVIVVAANAISLLTSLSLAAISTNFRMKGGGDYYLISRTLGLPFGGSLGVILFFAQSVSIGFYCVGFAEALAAILGWHASWSTHAIAIGAIAMLFVLAWLGTDWATRFQYVVMALVGIGLIAFFLGATHHWREDILVSNWEAPASALSFWAAFAIFFPAVTGFTQGVSMSGDLRDAGHSIPRGTFAAVGFAFVIYLAVAIALAGALPLAALARDYDAMKKVASFGWLIDGGVIAATLSSGMASFLGAPRILQSLARDRVFPLLAPFAEGSGASNNPRRGVLAAAAVALSVAALGDLNAVASVVSMFFLISYGLLNFATYYEIKAGSPSFRPRFRWYDHRASLLGFLVCIGTMLAINPIAGILAIAIVFGVFQYLRHRNTPARWADTRRSYHLQQVREHLIAAAADVEHPRDWRPIALVFTDDSKRRPRLLRFASWIESGSGLITAVQVVLGRGTNMVQQRENAAEGLKRELAQMDSHLFALAVEGPNLESTIPTILQSSGIGPLRVNTVIVNWIEDSPALLGRIDTARYGQNLRNAFRLGCNLIVLDADEREWSDLEATRAEARRIVVWWSEGPSGDLMLVLAHLLRRNKSWASATIEVLATEDKADTESLAAMVGEARIEAEPILLPGEGMAPLLSHSQGATLVFLPFTIRGGHFFHPFGGEVPELLPELPVAVLVMARRDFDIDTDPDQGAAGEAAALSDRLEDATKRLAAATRELENATAALNAVRADVTAESRQDGDAQRMEVLWTKLSEAETGLRRAHRRADRLAAIKKEIERRIESEAKSPSQK
jgi:amino acid transporter